MRMMVKTVLTTGPMLICVYIFLVCKTEGTSFNQMTLVQAPKHWMSYVQRLLVECLTEDNNTKEMGQSVPESLIIFIRKTDLVLTVKQVHRYPGHQREIYITAKNALNGVVPMLRTWSNERSGGSLYRIQI